MKSFLDRHLRKLDPALSITPYILIFSPFPLEKYASFFGPTQEIAKPGGGDGAFRIKDMIAQTLPLPSALSYATATRPTISSTDYPAGLLFLGSLIVFGATSVLAGGDMPGATAAAETAAATTAAGSGGTPKSESLPLKYTVISTVAFLVLS